MKKLIFTFLIACSIFLISCEKDKDTTPDFPLAESDVFLAAEYDVYGVILGRYSASQLVVSQQTSVFTPPAENFELFFNLSALSEMEGDLFANYEEVNDFIFKLDAQLEVPGKEVKLMSNAEYDYYFDRANPSKGWDLFDKKYPAAGRWFFHFNKIGFNESQDQAMVGVESYWFEESADGPTLKMGRLYYLEKVEGVWTYVASTSYQL
jgi:hypothetical protein